MDKAEKKKLLRQYKQAETERFRQALPMPEERFRQLFDYLDEKLGETDCQHDLSMTTAFLKQSGCPVDAVLVWLEQNGAGCDCEVLANVEDLFD